MKKNLFILLAAFFMLFTSCSEKQATEFTHSDYEDILINSNWIEITDTLIPDLGCSSHPGAPDEPHSQYLQWDKLSVFNNIEEFNKLSNEMDTRNCWNKNHQYIDFNRYTLLAYSSKTGIHNSYTQFFENIKTKEYKLIVHINIESRKLILYTLRNWLLVPKLKEDFNISVDTLKYLPE